MRPRTSTVMAAACVCGLVVLAQRETRTQAPAATFTAVTTALTSAAQAIATFVENLEKATRAGLRTYDLVAARRAADVLRAIGARAAPLPGEQAVLVVDPIEQYLTAANAALKRGAPLPLTEATKRWAGVNARLDQVVPKVEGLLAEVKAAAASFVDPKPYNAFLAALGGRQLVLAELRKMPPPRSREETTQLQTLHDRYQELITQLQRANAALEDYIARSTTP
jgi:hypothetical protein